MNKTVLIIGSGGREHALAYGLAHAASSPRVFVCPGNGGTEALPRTKNISLKDHAEIIAFCTDEAVSMVVIGPELPLLDGLSDALRQAGIVTFGASQAAAQLEGSKSFATAFMQANHIPIPESLVVTSAREAMDGIATFGGPGRAVIKADGFAAGKGVFLPETDTEARTAIQAVTSGKVDGDGSRFVLQKRHTGPEVSIFALSDGENYNIIPIACQDHKRIGVGDIGPNTGGMGVYAPLPAWMLSDAQWQKIDTITKQTIDGMKQRDTPYQGVLYIGLMLSEQKNGDPIVIEYNARFGDPEAEVLIPLLMHNGVDIYDLLYAVASGSLHDITLPARFQAYAITICLAAAGYPQQPQTGTVIHGLEKPYPNVTIFHGSTRTDDNGNVITSGGRVVYISAIADSLERASEAANDAIGDAAVHFDGMQFRHDIGYRAFSGPKE